MLAAVGAAARQAVDAACSDAVDTVQQVRETGELFALVAQAGIELRWARLRPYFNGVYLWEPPKPPYIYLDVDLADDPVLLRAVLAEELGHHFTRGASVGWETRAFWWAVDYLVSERELGELLRAGATLWEMSGRLQVPVLWVRRKLERIGAAWYARGRGVWSIGGG